MFLGNPPTYAAAEKYAAQGLGICVIPSKREIIGATNDGKPKFSHTLHPSLNDWTGLHRMQIHKMKIEWENWYIDHLRNNKFPKTRGGPVFIFIAYNFATNQRHDYDNMAPKFLLDALTMYGAIEDDSDQILGAHPFIVHRVFPATPHILLAVTKDRSLYRELIDEFLP